MVINNHIVNPGVAQYDGCHKIYIPTDGQELQFIKDINEMGASNQLVRIHSADELRDMYINSCGLRFIQRVFYGPSGPEYENIIPQCAFVVENEDGAYFDEEAAAAAFQEV